METPGRRVTQDEAVEQGLERAWSAALAFALSALILFGLTGAWSWRGLVPLPKKAAAERPFERL